MSFRILGSGVPFAARLAMRFRALSMVVEGETGGEVRDKKIWFARCLAAERLRACAPLWRQHVREHGLLLPWGDHGAWDLDRGATSRHHLGAFCCFRTPWAAVKGGMVSPFMLAAAHAGCT